MIAQQVHTTPISPFRRGLTDMMADTERRAPRAYESLLGRPHDYVRERDLPKIFGSRPIARVKPPSPAFDLVVTQLIIAALKNAKRRFESYLPRNQKFYGALLEDVEVALHAERRTRIEQIALERF